MKVVSFHSFKGGRGRTTAIANLANLCARLGKHVVLLDADVTAPWLHTRYALGSKAIHDRAWLRGLLDELALSPPSVIPDCDLDDYWLRVDSLSESGSIRLLAPGNPDEPAYWQWMIDQFPRLMGFRRSPHIVESWRDLRLLIASADPEPDIMFVDAPAGYHEASAFVAIGLADTAVVFAGADESDSKWTTKLVEMIRAERSARLHGRYGDLRVVGARGRYPEYIHPTYEGEEHFREFVGRFLTVDFDDFVSLDSDPRLELASPKITIPLEGKVRETQLARCYGKLLAAILPGDWPVGSNPLDTLPSDTLVPGESPSFFWLQDHGVLTNPADSQRNVAFRVETFCGLLDDLHGDLIPLGSERPGETPEASRALEKAGAAPGIKFGRSLYELLGAGLSDHERLMRWCEFDSRVGFGHLTLSAVTEAPDRHVQGGEIEVVGNFLAAERTADSPDLCALMSGYVAGVLGELLACAHVRIEHPAEACMRLSPDRSSCGFRFTIDR